MTESPLANRVNLMALTDEFSRQIGDNVFRATVTWGGTLEEGSDLRDLHCAFPLSVRRENCDALLVKRAFYARRLSVSRRCSSLTMASSCTSQTQGFSCTSPSGKVT